MPDPVAVTPPTHRTSRKEIPRDYLEKVKKIIDDGGYGGDGVEYSTHNQAYYRASKLREALDEAELIPLSEINTRTWRVDDDDKRWMFGLGKA